MTRAPLALVTPQDHKPADGPGAQAEPLQFPVELLVAFHLLGPLDEPLDEHAGLGVRQPARQRVVLQNVTQPWSRQHSSLSPPDRAA